MVVDSETVTVSTTAIGLTQAKMTGAIGAVTIHAEGNIRYWTSGKAPTSTDGIPMYDGTEKTFTLSEATNFRAYRKDAVDAKIHAQYHAVVR